MHRGNTNFQYESLHSGLASHPKTIKNKTPLSEDPISIRVGILLPTGCTSKNSTENTCPMSKPVTSETSMYVKILLDSRASASIICEKYTHMNFLRKM